jgi:hypothetical protein
MTVPWNVEAILPPLRSRRDDSVPPGGGARAHVNPGKTLNVFGWITAAVMTAAAIGLILTWGK